ncbi:alpha/beta fold hydrolase [Francisella halioticida]|uniref:alpha/beta fold hydrolase n=1 Tax=Francisella halioticida TaxID=549298 RepID=UPI001BB4365C|nr:alpha/beta hydrolase [Francisella halioticida]
MKKDDLTKPTIVFIHGLGADKDTWVKLSKYLTRNFRIIALDLPGHGDSYIANNYTIESQAKTVINLLNFLNIASAHFIGSSMGAAAVISVTNINPELVLSLTLIDSYGFIKEPSYIDKLVDNENLNPMININSRNDYRKMLSLAMYKPPFIPNFILDVMAESMQKRVDLNNKIFTELNQNIEQKLSLSVIEQPSLIIWGENDNLLNVNNSKIFYENIKNSYLVVLKNTGHVPMVERPKEVAKNIKYFIKEKVK